MAGNKIIFKDRVSTNVNRKKLTIIEPSNGTTMLVDVERADTSISELGTPLNAETMNNLLQVANVVDTLGTSTTDVMSQKGVTDNINIINKQDTASNWQNKNSTLKLGEFGYDTTNNIIKIGNGTSPWQNLSSFNSSQFTDATGAINYIGKNVSLTISNGVHILTNCTGSVNVNSSTVELYVHNSPKLTLTGKNNLNWEKIWIDGMASNITGTKTKWQDGRMEYRYTMEGTTSITNVWGGLYESPSLNLGALNDPPFIVYPQVFCTPECFCWHEGVVYVTPTSAGVVYLLRPIPNPEFPYRLMVLAVGRWK